MLDEVLPEEQRGARQQKKSGNKFTRGLLNFEEKPDLTEDFFGLLLRYAKFTPTLIL